MTGYPSVDKPWLKYYTEEQINTPLPDCSLYEYLWECNKEHLNDYALNYFGNKITYRELFSKIDETARAFVAIGVKEKEIIPIISVSTVTSIVVFYALNKLGAVSDFINVLLEEKDLLGMFREVNAKVVVTLDVFGSKVVDAAKGAGVKTIVAFGVNQEMPALVDLGYRFKTAGQIPAMPKSDEILSWKAFIRKSTTVKEITYKKNSEEMCILAHTGGTTGTPKAVMLSDKAMNAVAGYYKQCFNYTRGETWANVMIPFVVYGILTCLHVPMTLGLTTVVIPKFDGKDWAKYFNKYDISYILAVPAYINVLSENPKYDKLDLSCLKLCGVGGDGMTTEKEEKLNLFFSKHGAQIEVLKGYGMSELCATAVTGLVGINKVGSVGIPLIHNNLMIYDTERKCELPYGEIGEICIQSPSRMIGYLDNEEATSELFKKHPDGSEWLHTGDLGYIDEDGFLYLVGRMKRVILTTRDGVAYKVFPNIPERVLASHTSVEQSCIVGVKNGDDDALRAYVVLKTEDRDKTTDIESELRRICNEELPSYSRPTFYVFLDKLPLTAAGKVDYRALEKI